MNLAHLHLLLNHFPTVGEIIGLALLVVSLVRKDDRLRQASLVVLLAIAALALLVYMTGNAASEMVQARPDVSQALVSKHQDAAMLALVFMTIAGVLAWLGLWHFSRTSRHARWNVLAVLLVSIVTLGLMTRAATLGGEIRHEEIRADPKAADAGGVVASVGAYVRDNGWVWPTCEILHYIGLSLLFGTVLAINLRLLGFMKSIPLVQLRGLLPWGLAGFGVNVVTGMVFFVATPTQYTQNVAFHWKVVFMLLAAVNILYLTFDESWDLAGGEDAPLTAKVIAGAGIFLWAGVIFWGRMLPYIGNSF